MNFFQWIVVIVYIAANLEVFVFEPARNKLGNNEKREVRMYSYGKVVK